MGFMEAAATGAAELASGTEGALAGAFGVGAAESGAASAGGAASFGAGLDLAAEATGMDGMGMLAGQSGVKDFFAQAFDNAKQDVGDIIDRNVVRDASGEIDGWKTAGNMGYNAAKNLIATAAAGGGDDPQDTPQKIAEPKTPSAPTPPDAEAELNKLRNRINA